MDRHEPYNYTIRAERRNRTDIVISIASYLSAAVMYYFSAFVNGIKYPAILQMLALVFLCIGIFVNQRYTWPAFVYAVKPRENRNTEEFEGYAFLVYKLSGKKSVCLANIKCTECIDIFKCTKKSPEKERIAKYVKPAKYSFTQTMCPAEYYTAVFETDGGIAIIRFEPDEVLADLMRELMTDASAAEE